MNICVRRREFISLFSSAAVGVPLAARAQQRGRMRRIGVLMNLAADDPESSARLTAFVQGLQQLGWTDGRNVQVEIRWGAGNPDLFRRYAVELVALAPDVILAASGATVPPLLQVTRSIPIVFAQTPDPVGTGYVSSLARPGGNATGFTQIEFGMSAKWLEFLKQIAPRVARVGVLRDVANIELGLPQFGALQAVSASFGVELTAIGVRDATTIERDINEFVRGENDGLIITASPLTAVHRHLIISLAAKHHLPAVYPFRYYAIAGGLISYGADPIDQYRRAAGYVDRILKGEKPADLPVQAPVKYDLVINLKTAKALGLAVPPSLFAVANEVIE
jgi:putative ABC transport system substrate-binding protein